MLQSHRSSVLAIEIVKALSRKFSLRNLPDGIKNGPIHPFDDGDWTFSALGRCAAPPQMRSTSALISCSGRMGSFDPLTASIRSWRRGLIAIPRSVTTTSINSPGPHSVVTSSTMTGMRSRNEGTARMVHPAARQFCQPPMPCSSRPSECVTTLALKFTSTSVAPSTTASTMEAKLPLP